MKRGQVWSADYTVGFILFLITLLLVTSVLSRTLLVRDTFPEVRQSAMLMSQQLIGVGYPVDWRDDDVLLAGLTTNGELSMRKGMLLADIADDNYAYAKSLVNTKYEWSISFEDVSGALLSVGTACAIGSGLVAETKSIEEWNQSLAYYYRSSGGLLLANMTALNASLFLDEEFPSLFTNKSFDMIVMEEPDLATISSPYDAEKAKLLESYVEEGGRLFVIGNLNLSEAFDMNISMLNSSLNASGNGTTSDFFNFSGKSLENLTGYALTAGDQRRFSSKAIIDVNRTFAAHFTAGDGDVYYLGSLDGTLNVSGISLLEHIARQIKEFQGSERALCTSIEHPQNVKNRVVIRRLVAFDGEILVMKVAVWEE